MVVLSLITPMPSTQTFIYTFLAGAVLFLVFRHLFNSSSSSGKRAPGPRPWPILGNLPHLGPAPHDTLAKLSKIYGPIMHLKFGFNDVIVVSSASAAKQFLKVNDAKVSSRPSSSGSKHIAYNNQDMVFAPYGPRWRMLRKVTQVHLFSNKALDDFRLIRQEEVAVLTRALAFASEEPKDIPKLLNICTTNALSRIMLGKKVFSDIENTVKRSGAGADEFKDMVIEMMVLAGVFNISDFIPSLEFLDLQGVAKKMKKLHKRFDEFLSEFLEEKKNQGHGKVDGKHTDFLSILLELKESSNEEEKLTDVGIKALMLNLFSAGTDTCSSTMEWGMAELIRHPEVVAQARAEIDAVVGRDRLVTEADLPQLTYLHAVVKEIFRTHPSTPLSIPRMATEDCEIDGYQIPKGSILLVNLWAISRDPEAWTDPLEFRPERFMPGGEKANVDVRGNDFDVIPFGAGRRICAGMSMGVRVVTLLTATLVQAFDWELPRGQTVETLNMEEAFGLSLRRAATLLVHPKLRLSPEALYHV